MVNILALVLALQAADDLASKLRELSPIVVPADSEKGKQLPRMLSDDARMRIRAANGRESAAWQALQTLEQWEQYRDRRIKALRESLGTFPDPPKALLVKVTRTLEGDGYRIENVLFENGLGLQVTANLYSPAKAGASMPGIQVVHSHHNPKTQSELQDMGVLWARAGCLVIVLDQLGHGERRQHAFKDASSYPGTFRPTRQDYFFRYNSALQLHLIGESLIGWMAWDQMRAVDLLLARGADKEKIILLGSVAGGGDPAGVTAAVDPRITCVVPFNFGGPQPETTYPLPEDAEAAFNYAGGGSWESVRNLRLSARDGFLPWVIVGSVAPRRLVHAHEFAWDRERDPVWKRYGKIFEFYGKPDHLASAHGGGRVTGQPPESTHCNNIGAAHRKAGIYQAFQRWFGIAPPDKEPADRRPAADLMCVPADVTLRPLHEVAAEIGASRKPAAVRDWSRVLGDIDPREGKAVEYAKDRVGDVAVQRAALEIGSATIPFILLTPSKEGKRPLVVAFGQEGKALLLKNRSAEIAELLGAGTAVCLADLRGTGETRVGDSVARTSSLTSLSATELMLGQTLLGSRVRDLRSLLRHLRTRPDIDDTRIAFWGDSFASPNGSEDRVEVPWDAEKLPRFAHPAGHLTAVFAMLFEPDVRCAWTRGGLESFASILKSPYLYVPHDAVIPGALPAGDLPDVEKALAPRPVRFIDRVDGVNRRVKDVEGSSPSAWLREQLR